VGAILGSINISYQRNRWLIDVINFLANEIKTGVTVSSDFFTAAINPVTLANNHLLHLTIAQKSDIARHDTSDPAAYGMMSWNEMMDILWSMFQVSWDYDSATDTINIEHISWWTYGPGLDLRTQALCKATNKYSYIKENMPKYEYFSFMEASRSSFIGLPIWYDSKCVDNNPETNKKTTVINVTTDLEYIINYREQISDEGFVILCNYEDGGLYYVEVQASAVFGVVALNNHLGWENLHNYYFRHNRVLIEGYLNGVLTDFYTAQKNRVQECFAIVCPSDDFDPNDTITTELGETYFGSVKATVKQAQLKPSGEMKFTLGYGVTGEAPAPIPDPKWIYVYEVKGANKTTYTAICSEVTGAAVTIGITLVLQDVDFETCTTAEYDLVIPLGSDTDTIDIPWCVPVATPATCIVTLLLDDSDAITKGWFVYIEYDNESHC